MPCIHRSRAGVDARVRFAAAVTFGSRLPDGIRSSSPTPPGSCWRTCQAPPNPLARFRASLRSDV
ncbi:DUF1472 domain-containing protein [Salmonella enterica subsp. enterica serovar Reading]|nr:DUF1472 domain-containing protein [Salmonella enterica subsp. enterica serovar Reading]